MRYAVGNGEFLVGFGCRIFYECFAILGIKVAVYTLVA